MPKVYSIKTKTVENGVERKKEVTIDLSFKTMLFILLLLAVIFFGSQLLTIFMFLLLGFVFMSTALPIVSFFNKRNISRGWSVFLAYAFIILVILVVFSVVVIPLASQISSFVDILPTWIDELITKIESINIAGHSLNLSSTEAYINELLQSIPTADNFKSVTSAISSVFGTLSIVFTALIFSIYLVLEHNSLLDIVLIRISSDEKKNMVKKLAYDMERKLGNWVLGQGLVSLLATIYSGIVLSILGVPFAIPLAVFVGLCGLIPNFGATIAGIGISLIAIVTVGPAKAIIALSLFLLYQPLENNYLSPKIMGNAVGLKPVVVILGVMAMFILFGPLGAPVTVPVMVLIKIFYDFYVDLQKLKAKGIV